MRQNASSQIKSSRSGVHYDDTDIGRTTDTKISADHGTGQGLRIINILLVDRRKHLGAYKTGWFGTICGMLDPNT